MPSVGNVDRPSIRLYLMTCPERIGSPLVQRTFDSIGRSDWGEQPIVQVDEGEPGQDPKERQTENYRRLLERIAYDEAGYALVTEDDVVVNRHLRRNLEGWGALAPEADAVLGSLYNPNLRPLPGASAISDGFVADPEAVYGSQAFLITPGLARYCLQHWLEVPGLQDIKISRLAAARPGGRIVVHSPSLVQHVGSAESTHGAPVHSAVDFDPWWVRDAEVPLGTHGLSWQEVRGWFDWPRFYQEQVERLPHGSVVVEVGILLGRSVIYLAQTMKAHRKDLRVVAVDTFRGCGTDPLVASVVAEHGGSLRSAFERNLVLCGVEDAVEILEQDSESASRQFPDSSVDLVFLDGDHGFDGFRRDLIHWMPKVKPGGLIAGHDINTYESIGQALDSVLGKGSYHIDHSQNIWKHRR